MRGCNALLRVAAERAARRTCVRGVMAIGIFGAAAGSNESTRFHEWGLPSWMRADCFVLCEPARVADDEEPHQYVPPPAKLDDPEENAKVLASWRSHIQQARELFSRLDVTGAERELRIALEEAMHFGQSSGPVATSLLNLAQLLKRAGRPAEAEPLLLRAADVLDQTAGPNNKVTLLALLDLAGTHMDLGKAADALGVYKDVLSRLDAAEINQPHGKLALREVRAGCLLHMAKAASEIDDLEEAEIRLREALALVKERHGTQSTRLLAPYTELARLLKRRGKSEEAEDCLRRAVELPELRESQKKTLSLLSQEMFSRKPF